MIEHENVTISRSSYYVDFRRSGYNNEENLLKIEYRSDAPSQEDIKKFIKNQHPQLQNKEIDRIYYDNDWLSEYNMGNPVVCFAITIVFFK